MVLIVGLDCRLLAAFSLWLVSIIARLVKVTQTLNIEFRSTFSRFVFFLVNQSFLLEDNGEQLE